AAHGLLGQDAIFLRIPALDFHKPCLDCQDLVVPAGFLAGRGLAEVSSLPTESSTPLINCTDSGEENLRAISSASLITTGRGVAGSPRNSATLHRSTLRSTAAILSTRQCCACLWMMSSIS